MQFDIPEIKTFMSEHPAAKIYLGVDSQKVKKRRIRFSTVVIVHYEGRKGAKVFNALEYHDVHEGDLSKPFQRMMKEVSIVTDLYFQLEDVLIDRDFEIHLDISQKASEGSNVALGAAKGMIWGTVGVEAVFKPDAFAASCAADYYSKGKKGRT